MEKTASVLAEELDKLAEQLENEANLNDDSSLSTDYVAGLVRGMGLDGQAGGV